MNFRKSLFSVYDASTGFKMSRYIKEIQNRLIEGPCKDDIENIKLHIFNTVPFYKCYIGKQFTDLPVVNKSIIKLNIDAFLSERFKDKKIISLTTSGSTGTPFTIYHNRDKRVRNYADTLVFAQLAGYQLGDRLLYFKIWAKEKMSNPCIYRIQNVVPIDVVKLDDLQIKCLLSDLKRNPRTHSVLGYVSALEQVVRYCELNNISDLQAKFSSVITMSESLDVGTKKKLEQLFKCAVVSRYSNLENGIIAQQEPGIANRFLLNTASYYVEIMDFEKDEILKEGEKGRIVVTDLFNYAMPMVRYDTGDIGSIETGSNGLKYLKTVEGRKLDVLFDCDGNIVSSFIMYKNMWKYTEISQYQLIQKGEKEYVFKINCLERFLKEDQLTAEFKQYLGSNADFRIEYVNEIPLLNSGKRRKIVNLYRNSI